MAARRGFRHARALRRRFALRLLMLALPLAVAAVAGCGEDDNGDGGQAGGAPITLSVGVDSVYAPMFVAQDEGLFEAEGVTVELRQFAQGGEGVDAMLAGEIDAAGSADSTFVARGTEGVRALAPYVEEGGSYVKLVVRDGIDDVAQIERIGVIPGQISEYGAQKLFEAEGIDPASVEQVKVAGPPEMPALLERGEIDAFVLNEPWPARAVEEEAGKVLAVASDFELTYTLVVAARPEWLEHNRERAGAMMRALAEAARTIEQDPDLAAEATEKAAKVEPEQTVQAVEELDFGVRDFTRRDIARLNDVADFLVDRGLIKSRPQVEEVFPLAQGFGAAGGG
jgi:ABC-type nitrate/sulfonate/bicarbonate transport system substrate-binding protein